MRRGIKTYTTLRAAIVACALYAGLLTLSVSGLLRMETISQFTLAVTPIYLMITAFVSGILPMLVCELATFITLGILGEFTMLTCGGVYLLPMTVAFLFCVLARERFVSAVRMLVVALVGGHFCLWAMLRYIFGMSLELALANRVIVAVYTHPYRDGILYNLLSNGLLEIPVQLQETAIVSTPEGLTFSVDALNELLLQIRDTVMRLVHAALPVMFLSGSVLTALTGLSLGIYYGQRAAQRRAFKRNEELQQIPDLGMPPLRTWHLPRPWGLRVGVLAVGYLLMRYGQNDVLYILGSLMWQTFTLCFGIQGLASINAHQHRRGTSRSWRVAVIAASLVFQFLQTALVIVGVVDQFSNVRGLRPPLRPRDEEE